RDSSVTGVQTCALPISLAQATDCGRSQKEADDAVFVAVAVELAVVANHRRNDAGGTVSRRGDHAAACRVLLVDGDRVDTDPVDRLGGTLLGSRTARAQRLDQARSAPAHVEAARQQAFVAHAALDAVVHY